jgi:hypothetical protein
VEGVAAGWGRGMLSPPLWSSIYARATPHSLCLGLKNRDWLPLLGEISDYQNTRGPKSLVSTEDGTESRRHATAGWCQRQRRGHGAGTPTLTSRELRLEVKFSTKHQFQLRRSCE